jgi:hypothetical protein
MVWDGIRDMVGILGVGFEFCWKLEKKSRNCIYNGFDEHIMISVYMHALLDITAHSAKFQVSLS